VGLMPTPENWPSQGRVTFDNVSMRYRPELPLVLQNVSFDLKVSGCCCCCGETRLMKCVAKRVGQPLALSGVRVQANRPSWQRCCA
jgi:hypothetical protein